MCKDILPVKLLNISLLNPPHEFTNNKSSISYLFVLLSTLQVVLLTTISYQEVTSVVEFYMRQIGCVNHKKEVEVLSTPEL